MPGASKLNAQSVPAKTKAIRVYLMPIGLRRDPDGILLTWIIPNLSP
ncbi:MAG: hypothetical protein KDB48_09410 [Solirubrobacterales bacterium]|nr:hypothetical protein [Solirubrobacterales bacterium]HMT04024.1 hypothetical protein [Solirubrobacterales bacterium]